MYLISLIKISRWKN